MKRVYEQYTEKVYLVKRKGIYKLYKTHITHSIIFLTNFVHLKFMNFKTVGYTYMYS